MASPSSSELPSPELASTELASSAARVRAGLRAIVLVSALVSALGAMGCVTVRPEQREFLADRSMTFGSGGQLEADTDHVLDNREGSAGAATVSGGGCGCN